MFYQACKVTGKNSYPCSENKVDGTDVIEVALDAKPEMVLVCDCVGILKERFADVEARFPKHKTWKAAKKKSTKCRLVFRTSIINKLGVRETLQVTSDVINCTQLPGTPEVLRMSTSSSLAAGGGELWMIGKNFLKDTKIVFSYTVPDKKEPLWSESRDPNPEFLHQSHLITTIPPFFNLNIEEEVEVNLFVRCADKMSESHSFVYKPCVSVSPAVKCVCALPKGVAAPAVAINHQFATTGSVNVITSCDSQTLDTKSRPTILEPINAQHGHKVKKCRIDYNGRTASRRTRSVPRPKSIPRPLLLNDETAVFGSEETMTNKSSVLLTSFSQANISPWNLQKSKPVTSSMEVYSLPRSIHQPTHIKRTFSADDDDSRSKSNLTVDPVIVEDSSYTTKADFCSNLTSDFSNVFSFNRPQMSSVVTPVPMEELKSQQPDSANLTETAWNLDTENISTEEKIFSPAGEDDSAVSSVLYKTTSEEKATISISLPTSILKDKKHFQNVIETINNTLLKSSTGEEVDEKTTTNHFSQHQQTSQPFGANKQHTIQELPSQNVPILNSYSPKNSITSVPVSVLSKNRKRNFSSEEDPDSVLQSGADLSTSTGINGEENREQITWNNINSLKTVIEETNPNSTASVSMDWNTDEKNKSDKSDSMDWSTNSLAQQAETNSFFNQESQRQLSQVEADLGIPQINGSSNSYTASSQSTPLMTVIEENQASIFTSNSKPALNYNNNFEQKENSNLSMNFHNDTAGQLSVLTEVQCKQPVSNQFNFQEVKPDQNTVKPNAQFSPEQSANSFHKVNGLSLSCKQYTSPTVDQSYAAASSSDKQVDIDNKQQFTQSQSFSVALQERFEASNRSNLQQKNAESFAEASFPSTQPSLFSPSENFSSQQPVAQQIFTSTAPDKPNYNSPSEQLYSSTPTEQLYKTPSEQLFTSPSPAEQIYASPAAVEQIYTSPVPENQHYISPTPAEQLYTSPAPKDQIYTAPATVEQAFKSQSSTELLYTTPAPAEQLYSSPAPVEQIYTSPAPTDQIYTAPATVEQVYKSQSPTEQLYTTPAPAEQLYSSSAPGEELYTSPAPVQQIYTAPAPVEQVYKSQPSVEQVYKAPAPAENLYSSHSPAEKIYTSPAPSVQQLTSPLAKQYSAAEGQEQYSTNGGQLQFISPTQEQFTIQSEQYATKSPQSYTDHIVQGQFTAYANEKQYSIEAAPKQTLKNIQEQFSSLPPQEPYSGVSGQEKYSAEAFNSNEELKRVEQYSTASVEQFTAPKSEQFSNGSTAREQFSNQQEFHSLQQPGPEKDQLEVHPSQAGYQHGTAQTSSFQSSEQTSMDTFEQNLSNINVSTIAEKPVVAMDYEMTPPSYNKTEQSELAMYDDACSIQGDPLLSETSAVIDVQKDIENACVENQHRSGILDQSWNAAGASEHNLQEWS